MQSLSGLEWKTVRQSIKNYIFMTDNGGNLMCLGLNTLQLVWVQDTLDDSNSTPVLEIEKDICICM